MFGFFPPIRVGTDRLEESILEVESKYDEEGDFDPEVHQNHWKVDCRIPSVPQQSVVLPLLPGTKKQCLVHPGTPKREAVRRFSKEEKSSWYKNLLPHMSEID